MEEWSDVVGYESYFLISSKGRVFSKRTNKILKQFKNKNGYMVFATRIGGRHGKSFCFKVHRLVAMAFIPSKLGSELVNHVDGVKTNNNVENLEWCTNKENCIHAVKTGLTTSKRGLENKLCTVTEEQLLYIMCNYKPGDRFFGARAIGRRLNLDKNQVINVFNLYKSRGENEKPSIKEFKQAQPTKDV